MARTQPYRNLTIGPDAGSLSGFLDASLGKTARRSLLGTFYDEEVHRYVDVEPERGEVLYHFAIGHPVAGPRFKR